MFWRLDHEGAVDISNTPNEKLKSLLDALFTCLNLLKVRQVQLLSPETMVVVILC